MLMGAAKDTPFVSIVFPGTVLLNVIKPVAVHEVLAINDIEPLIFSVPVLKNTTVPAETVIPAQFNAPDRPTV